VEAISAHTGYSSVRLTSGGIQQCGATGVYVMVMATPGVSKSRHRGGRVAVVNRWIMEEGLALQQPSAGM
jgi:hypothetical protein